MDRCFGITVENEERPSPVGMRYLPRTCQPKRQRLMGCVVSYTVSVPSIVIVPPASGFGEEVQEEASGYYSKCNSKKKNRMSAKVYDVATTQHQHGGLTCDPINILHWTKEKVYE